MFGQMRVLIVLLLAILFVSLFVQFLSNFREFFADIVCFAPLWPSHIDIDKYASLHGGAVAQFIDRVIA